MSVPAWHYLRSRLILVVSFHFLKIFASFSLNTTPLTEQKTGPNWLNLGTIIPN